MKKVLVVLTVVAVLGLGAVAFAGWGGPGYGYGMGPGMMYGYGPGYGMMGYGPGYGAYSGDNAKFLKDTADLRRTISQKRFDYFEAVRTGDEKKAEALSKELDGLYDKLAEKAPEGFRGGYARGGYGPMMGYGCNW